MFTYDDSLLAEVLWKELSETKRDNILRGEASVSYLYYDDVPKKIKTYNPDAKIIIVY